MNNLVIGNTSQLAYYFPDDYEKVSSRNLDTNLYRDKFYNRVFLTFAENRVNEIHDLEAYIKINTELTIKLATFFSERANFVIVYGSCELWNNYTGAVSINDEFVYDLSGPYFSYCFSKERLNHRIHILNLKNVLVLHPFNFNSPYRKPNFLFNKIFYSLKNKKPIEIGDTYFYRDIVHPKYVVERSMQAVEDEIVGSGRLTFVNDFIRELYTKSGLKYEDYVIENFDNRKDAKKNFLYLESKEIKYNNLLQDTLNDLNIK